MSEPREKQRAAECRALIDFALPVLSETARSLLASSASSYNPDLDTGAVLERLERLRAETPFCVERVDFAALDGWYFDPGKNLRHRSGKFFSIEGLQVATNVGPTLRWSQPIICQREVGVLGILCQRRRGILYFLMQAKIEPGNVNRVQLAATVQATKSNFSRVHRGAKQPFIEHFFELEDRKVLFDILQSEQGARFHKKRNRNVLVEIGEDERLELPPSFFWLTLRQLKELMKLDNIVNMDARTVLACMHLPSADSALLVGAPGVAVHSDPLQTDLFASLCGKGRAYHSLEEIIGRFTRLKMDVQLEAERCDLDQVEEWRITDREIVHDDQKYFRVIGIDVETGAREIERWCQPIIWQQEEGIVGFILKKIHGLYHLLVQVKLEAGNFDLLEMAATVQCITGSYKEAHAEVPFLEYFTAGRGRLIYDTLQSEEGGRFYQEQNRYAVLEVGDEFPIDVGERHIWMTLGQAKEFIMFNNYFNVEARSLIACISPI